MTAEEAPSHTTTRVPATSTNAVINPSPQALEDHVAALIATFLAHRHPAAPQPLNLLACDALDRTRRYRTWSGLAEVRPVLRHGPASCSRPTRAGRPPRWPRPWMWLSPACSASSGVSPRMDWTVC